MYNEWAPSVAIASFKKGVVNSWIAFVVLCTSSAFYCFISQFLYIVSVELKLWLSGESETENGSYFRGNRCSGEKYIYFFLLFCCVFRLCYMEFRLKICNITLF